jgi:hypothetical protein
MNRELYVLRRRHGDPFVTRFLDGTEVPWKPLSLQEFIEYDRLFSFEVYPPSQLEDEVFSKCCLDVSLVENIDELEAGIVTTTVMQIMEASGPTAGTEQISYDLNIARNQAHDFFSQGVVLICQVFPGYTPEDVYALDYRTYLTRLAQAELRLLELGIMTQPLELLTVDGAPVETPAPQPRPKPKPRERFRDLNPTPPRQLSSDLHVVGAQDIAAGMEAYDPHERQDYLVTQFNERSLLLDGLEYIYPEYLQMVNRGESVTPEKIQEIKGKDFKAVERRHGEYVQKLKDGTIKPEVSKPEPVKPKKKKRVIVKRVQ